MALPGVKITLDNGALGAVSSSNDGISGLILTGVTVAGQKKVSVNTSYRIASLKEAEALGIEKTGVNAYAYTHIKAFYDAAIKSSELWIMLCTTATTMEHMLDKTKAFAPTLLNAAKGKIRKLGVSRESATGVTIQNGLDADVNKALIKGQALADAYAANFKPFRFLVDGKDFNGTVADLKDYRDADFNRGGVLLGSKRMGKNSSVGLAIGHLSRLPVQRKLSRVKNGSVKIKNAYFTNNVTTESLENAWGSIHDKGYIFFRTFVGKSGYYFNDDSTASQLTDDYAYFSRGFVIDKALVIAYEVYVNQVGNEIEVDDAGKLNSAVIKDLQGAVENAIELQMIANAQASAVEAIIDANQNVLATSRLNIVLRVRPVGYNNFIDIKLGFSNASNT